MAGRRTEKLNMNYVLALCFSLFITAAGAQKFGSLDFSEVEKDIEQMLKDKGVSQENKFKTVYTLAIELAGFKQDKKAIIYFEKAKELKPSHIDPLNLETHYLSFLWRKDQKKAEEYFNKYYKNLAQNSKKAEAKDFVALWSKIFAKEQLIKDHNGFFGQYFKDKDIKFLLSQQKFQEAFSLLNPDGINEADINRKLEYDVLSFLSGKKTNFFCAENLKMFPKSYALTMDLCRFVQGKALLNGTASELLEMVKKDMPHLEYLAEPLLMAEVKK